MFFSVIDPTDASSMTIVDYLRQSGLRNIFLHRIEPSLIKMKDKQYGLLMLLRSSTLRILKKKVLEPSPNQSAVNKYVPLFTLMVPHLALSYFPHILPNIELLVEVHKLRSVDRPCRSASAIFQLPSTLSTWTSFLHNITQNSLQLLEKVSRRTQLLCKMH